jgi:hypothetical protein
MDGLDLMEILRRAAKYLVEGGAVALAAHLVPQGHKLKLGEIVMIAVTAAATFAILDMYSPSIGAASKTGAGLGVGFGLIGGVPVA